MSVLFFVVEFEDPAAEAAGMRAMLLEELRPERFRCQRPVIGQRHIIERSPGAWTRGGRLKKESRLGPGIGTSLT